MRFQPFWFDQVISQKDCMQACQLKQDLHCDIVIVGGGFTGLWTAIQTKLLAPEKRVVVLEKDLCGQGASGRNGGAMLTWSTKFLSLQKQFGTEAAIELVKASEKAVYEIQAFTQKHQIDCELRLDGTFYTASNSAQIGILDPVMKALDLNNINSWQLCDKSQLNNKTGSQANLSGFFSPAAGSVQPAKLVRGLKRVAEQMDIEVFENSKVESFSLGANHQLKTLAGQVFAKQAVFAVNAWLPKLLPEFNNKVVLVSSDMAITPELPDTMNYLGLDHGASIIDSRIFVNYYRTTESGRLMLGKGGNYFSFNNKVSSRFDTESHYSILLKKSLQHFFGDVDLPIERTWTGPSDRSVTGFPFFGQLDAHKNVYFAGGYSGNGVVQSFLGGKILSALLLKDNAYWSQCALVNQKLPDFPPEPIRTPGAYFVRNAIRRKELAEDMGISANKIDCWLARLSGSAGKADAN